MCARAIYALCLGRRVTSCSVPPVNCTSCSVPPVDCHGSTGEHSEEMEAKVKPTCLYRLHMSKVRLIIAFHFHKCPFSAPRHRDTPTVKWGPFSRSERSTLSYLTPKQDGINTLGYLTPMQDEIRMHSQPYVDAAFLRGALPAVSNVSSAFGRRRHRGDTCIT